MSLLKKIKLLYFNNPTEKSMSKRLVDLFATQKLEISQWNQKILIIHIYTARTTSPRLIKAIFHGIINKRHSEKRILKSIMFLQTFKLKNNMWRYRTHTTQTNRLYLLCLITYCWAKDVPSLSCPDSGTSLSAPKPGVLHSQVMLQGHTWLLSAGEETPSKCHNLSH